MAAAVTRGAGRDDRVLPLTRGVSLVIIPFLVVAFFVLYPWPHGTGRLFAWDIKPTIKPTILGSVYLSGAYFFVRGHGAAVAHGQGRLHPGRHLRHAHGVATIAHWDKFLRAHVAFWLWAGLYFTTPFLIFWVWLANRGHDVPSASANLLIPARVSRVIAVLGALSVLTGLFLFLTPARAVAVWPWTVTPSTAQVLGAIFCLGIAWLGALFDRRWSSARILLQVAALMLVLILLAGVRAAGELDPFNAMTWLIAGGFAGVLAAIATLYLRMQRLLSRPATQG
jgi:hypothetical protein